MRWCRARATCPAPTARRRRSCTGPATVRTSPSPPLRDIHGQLGRWLALTPQDRPTARELAHELSCLTREQVRRKERKRLWWKLGPALCVVAALVCVLGLQLRKERVRSQRKDVRIEQQEIEIGQAREAIDALS